MDDALENEIDETPALQQIVAHQSERILIKKAPRKQADGLHLPRQQDGTGFLVDSPRLAVGGDIGEQKAPALRSTP